ncbi:hypothetical protein IT402_02700 [Candidatus Nomurabacteria bacterium]|nr:hypothetical protein [Candidatus Nomurabacteria bacterium]
MKIRHILVATLIVIGIFTTNTFNTFVHAQVTDCNDGVDNDKDGKVDYNGRIDRDGTKYPKDPECLTKDTLSESPVKGASDFDLKVRINNPLKVDTISDAIRLFMNAVLRIAIPFIIIFFIWSGLSFILARGNPDKIGTAKKMFWYTVIGTLLILGAWTITNIIIGTVNSVTG